MTSLDSINGRSIQTLLRGENDSKQSHEFQAMSGQHGKKSVTSEGNTAHFNFGFVASTEIKLNIIVLPFSENHIRATPPKRSLCVLRRVGSEKEKESAHAPRAYHFFFYWNTQRETQRRSEH